MNKLKSVNIASNNGSSLDKLHTTTWTIVGFIFL